MRTCQCFTRMFHNITGTRCGHARSPSADRARLHTRKRHKITAAPHGFRCRRPAVYPQTRTSSTHPSANLQRGLAGWPGTRHGARRIRCWRAGTGTAGAVPGQTATGPMRGPCPCRCPAALRRRVTPAACPKRVPRKAAGAVSAWRNPGLPETIRRFRVTDRETGG